MAYKAERSIDFTKGGAKRSSSRGRWPAEGAGDSASISGLSHDIRNQLYIIIGFAELMLEEVPGKINEEQRRNLNDVLTSGKRLQALLSNIVQRSENSQDGK